MVSVIYITYRPVGGANIRLTGRLYDYIYASVDGAVSQWAELKSILSIHWSLIRRKGVNHRRSTIRMIFVETLLHKSIVYGR